MEHTELVRKIEALPRPQRIAVEQLIDALAAVASHPRKPADIAPILAAARAAWPRKASIDDIDKDIAALRAEWDGRGWESTQ
jgi:hypothetical protein